MGDRFLLADGMPDIDAIEEWAEDYYQGLIKMMNPFYAVSNIDDIFASMRAIPFDKLLAQELAGESVQVIEKAMSLIHEIAEREIEYIKAYL